MIIPRRATKAGKSRDTKGHEGEVIVFDFVCLSGPRMLQLNVLEAFLVVRVVH